MGDLPIERMGPDPHDLQMEGGHIVDDLVAAATDLAVAVGPRSMAAALDALNVQLARIDLALDSGDDIVIDIRETRSVLEELEPYLALAEIRMQDHRSAMRGQ